MLKTNVKQLVKIAIEGKVAPALAYPNTVGHDGSVHNVPALGGITYNVLVGDPAFGWEADHVEPGVSSILNHEKRNDRPNLAYNFLACAGNEAIVLTGNAKGSRGRVVGHHGGAEHVMLDFAPAVLEKLSVDDRFQIRAFGQGLRLIEHPGVIVQSIDPEVISRIGLVEKGGRIEVPVAGIIPGALMGSGLGSNHARSGDYDMMSSDRKALERNGLTDLRLGDIVAIKDHDASFGWRYLEGAMVIGIVIHGDSHLSGHGPGIATIMTSPSGMIVPAISRSANIGRCLSIGRFRKKTKSRNRSR
ncbi:MAG: DUF4438 domain-containing protein [bacterium]